MLAKKSADLPYPKTLLSFKYFYPYHESEAKKYMLRDMFVVGVFLSHLIYVISHLHFNV